MNLFGRRMNWKLVPWHASDKRPFLCIYYRNNLCSKKYVWRVLSEPLVLLGSRVWHNTDPKSCRAFSLSKDVCHVASPARHGACAGRNRPCGPCCLSQRPSLSHVP